jgi:streptomycin adenylyltransferase
MDVPDARVAMIRQILVAVERDSRIVGVVDYGSGSEGRMDAWSDVDAALFVRDADFDAFARDWKTWAAQFGRLLLAYIGGVGHPWMVYDTQPMPLRVDFAFHRESALDTILDWPNAPTSPAAMVLYDATAGRLTGNARRLVGQSLRPPDLAGAFEQVGGDFWYYMLRTFSKLQRGQNWAARYDFNQIVLGNLLALLRLETGAVDRWRATSAAVQIEQAITSRRLAQLNACIPAADVASLAGAFEVAAELGRELCAALATAYGWPWPEQLAERTLVVLRAASRE